MLERDEHRIVEPRAQNAGLPVWIGQHHESGALQIAPEIFHVLRKRKMHRHESSLAHSAGKVSAHVAPKSASNEKSPLFVEPIDVILKIPFARSTGCPSAVANPCAKRRFFVVFTGSALPSTQEPSGAGAR